MNLDLLENTDEKINKLFDENSIEMVEEFTEGQDTIEVSTTNIDNITTLEAN
jgi:hypothetical protein